MGEPLSLPSHPNLPSLFLTLLSTMKDPAALAFQLCWFFFRATIPNFPNVTFCRMERSISASAKYIDDVPQGMILIGNCTSKAKREGLFVQGCPPVASEIWNTLEHSKRNF